MVFNKQSIGNNIAIALKEADSIEDKHVKSAIKALAHSLQTIFVEISEKRQFYS